MVSVRVVGPSNSPKVGRSTRTDPAAGARARSDTLYPRRQMMLHASIINKRREMIVVLEDELRRRSKLTGVLSRRASPELRTSTDIRCHSPRYR